MLLSVVTSQRVATYIRIIHIVWQKQQQQLRAKMYSHTLQLVNALLVQCVLGKIQSLLFFPLNYSCNDTFNTCVRNEKRLRIQQQTLSSSLQFLL